MTTLIIKENIVFQHHPDNHPKRCLLRPPNDQAKGGLDFETTLIIRQKVVL